MNGNGNVLNMPRARSAATPFGERLIAAMAHSGLTQQQIADKVGISQSTLGEAYRHDASKHTVQIALACGVQPVWLATGEGSMLQDERLHPAVRELAEKISQLPERQRKWVIEAAEHAIDMAREVLSATASDVSQIPSGEIASAKRRKAA